MCVLITACNVGVIGALFKMKRRSESRSLKNRKFNCFDGSKGKHRQEESIGLRNDTAGISVDRSNSTMTTSSRPSIRKREGSLAKNNANKEEVKFAILMVIIFAVLNLQTCLDLNNNDSSIGYPLHFLRHLLASPIGKLLTVAFCC